MIDPWQFFFWTVLAPSDGLVACVDEDSVRSALSDKSLLFLSIQCDRVLPFQSFFQ